MECKHCGKEFAPKRKVGATTCSDKCRQARRRQLMKPLSVTNAAARNRDIMEVDVTDNKRATLTKHPITGCAVEATLEHYQAHPKRYVQRREPERLNWTGYMTKAELVANRVPIPGDWDYEGIVDTETMTVKHQPQGASV